MKLTVASFKGELPIISNRLLPDGYGSAVVNAKVVSGDLDSYPDIGNFFQLAKAAPINTVWKIGPEGTSLYLQWTQTEVNAGYGTNIDVSYGTIPGDTSYRVFITGLNGGPQQTNLFYATDPSEQGGNPSGAYPYVTFPVGINDPSSPPTVVPPTVTGTTTVYQYAAEMAVNAGGIGNNAGTGYLVGDIVYPVGGTLAPGFTVGASFTVTTVGLTGNVTGLSIPPTTGGFYLNGSAPPTSNVATTTSGAGTGLTLDLTIVDNSFPPWNRPDHSNGSGYYATSSINGTNQWTLATGQGDIAVFYTISPTTLNTVSSFTLQADMETTTNNPDLILEFAGTYIASGNPNNVSGPAVVLSVQDGTFSLYSQCSGTNGGTVNGVIVDQIAYAVAANVFYRVTVKATGQVTQGVNSGFNVQVTLADQATPNTILASLSGFVGYNGEQLGIGQNQRSGTSGGDANYVNIQLTATQPANSANAETTAYVYTYVTTKGTTPNAMQEESGPSNPSPTVTFYLLTNPATGVVTMTPVQVTIPPAPTGEFITDYNLYRLVLQSDGSEVYQYVAQIAANFTAPVTYTDTTLDAELGIDLITADFVPPPSNMQGIIALPNGIMAGFFANVLCLSAQNYPYAFPVGNQLSTDYPIVAIAPVDTSVLVLTSAEPYTAWGNDPSAYNMSKETAPCGCVSKRSVATHRAAGAIYASGTGLWAYRGLGQLANLTSEIFDRDQWNAITPSTIIGAVYDDLYFFWYNSATSGVGGYMFDIRKGAAGIVALDFHVTAVFLDPQIDALEFTPDSSVYPVNGSVVAAPSNVLGSWEVGPGFRPRTWSRQEFLYQRPVCFQLCRVYADDYSSLNIIVNSEQGVAFSGAVTSSVPFIMAAQPGRQWSISVSGSSAIRSIELCENAAEFTPS
jgi:hypothetical protein